MEIEYSPLNVTLKFFLICSFCTQVGDSVRYNRSPTLREATSEVRGRRSSTTASGCSIRSSLNDVVHVPTLCDAVDMTPQHARVSGARPRIVADTRGGGGGGGGGVGNDDVTAGKCRWVDVDERRAHEQSTTQHGSWVVRRRRCRCRGIASTTSSPLGISSHTDSDSPATWKPAAHAQSRHLVAAQSSTSSDG